MSRTLLLAQGLILVATLTIAIGTMVAVVACRRTADHTREELNELMQASAHVSTLNALEWQAITEQDVSPDLRERFDRVRNAADASLSAVAARDPDNEEFALLSAYRAYAATVNDELALVEQGRLDAARLLDASTVDPMYEDLRADIDRQVQIHRHQAAASSQRSDFGLVVISGLGILMAGTLFWGQQTMRRRAQLAIAERDKAQALKASEEKFRQMVETLTEIIYVQDRNAIVTYISPAVRTLAGYEPGEIIGKPLSRFVHPEDIPRVAQAFLRTISGQPTPLEYRLLTSDGRVRWVRDSSQPIVEQGQIAGLRGVLMDITDFKTAQDEVRAAHSTLQAIFEASPLPIVAIDPNNRVTMWNRAAEQLFGWNADEVIGAEYPLVPPGGEAEYRVLLAKVLAGEAVAGVETKRRKKNGDLVDVAVYAAPVLTDRGEISGSMAVIADITEQKLAQETIRHLAYHDPLTGLPNHALLADRLEVALAQAQRFRQQLAVLYLDLDHFKVVNDSIGHKSGDLLLKSVAHRLRCLVRESDTVARVGGDEFTILLTPPCGEREASEIAERILTELRGPWECENQEFTLSASIGIAVYPTAGTDSTWLLKNADQAMYVAKAEGRDRLRKFRESMSTFSEQRLTLERDLRHALSDGQFVLYYQPQVDVQTGQIVGAEALLRWNHPHRGLLLPAEFLELAEEIGLIVEIDDWVMDTAARQLRAWHAAGHTQLEMAINLSAVHFQQPGLVLKMRRMLKRTGVNPSRFLIEITETAAINRTKCTARILSDFKRLGLRIAIDDFGTGHSSLTYLREFPVDAIKIDRSFINGIGRNPADETLVAAIVALAHSPGLDVIAEGVESDEQLQFLKNLRTVNPMPQKGRDCFQGFLSSRPISARELEALLDSETAALAAS